MLSRPYCEKVAASLAREGIVSTLDAMNYLKKISSGSSKSKSSQNNEEQHIVNESKDNDENLNWNQLVDDIDIDGGDDNGKA